jgi:hypothetical protein
MTADFRTTKLPYPGPAQVADTNDTNLAAALYCAQEAWKGNTHGA